MKPVSANEVRFETTPSGGLCLTLADGTRCESVHCLPMFPISNPREFIAILQRDDDGRDVEIGVIRRLSDLPREQRQRVMDDLKLGHFLPEITEVLSIRRVMDGDLWETVTDRGPRSFIVKSPRESLSFTAEGVVIVTDEHGLRHRISDPERLDRHSQAELQKTQV